LSLFGKVLAFALCASRAINKLATNHPV